MSESVKGYLENNSKAIELADTLSDLVINKVLAKDITMREALNATSLMQTFLVARTMPKERYQQQFDKSEPLAIELSNYIKTVISDVNYNVVDIIIAMSITLEYILKNLEEK